MKRWKRLPSVSGNFAPAPDLGAARIVAPGWQGKSSPKTGTSWASRFGVCQELTARSVSRVSRSGGLYWRPAGG